MDTSVHTETIHIVDSESGLDYSIPYIEGESIGGFRRRVLIHLKTLNSRIEEVIIDHPDKAIIDYLPQVDGSAPGTMACPLPIKLIYMKDIWNLWGWLG